MRRVSGRSFYICSSNGTFLNGERIPKNKPVRLRNRDEISLVVASSLDAQRTETLRKSASHTIVARVPQQVGSHLARFLLLHLSGSSWFTYRSESDRGTMPCVAQSAESHRVRCVAR